MFLFLGCQKYQFDIGKQELILGVKKV